MIGLNKLYNTTCIIKLELQSCYKGDYLCTNNIITYTSKICKN